MKKINELINDLKSPEVRNDISNNLKEKQEEFLESTLGKIINTGIDVGIKAVLPDWLEDEIIEIKDSILNDGFKSGIQMTINKAIDMGKAIEGIFTGNFESISQIKSVIKSGGLLDSISKLLDNVIDWAKKNKKINSSTAKFIKASKKTILETIENNIDNSLKNQVTAIEKLNGYIEKWTNYYNAQDLTNMKKIYTRIKNEMEKIIPIQDVLNRVEQVENLHELIINNGGDFNLSEEELELSTMLVY